MYSLLRNRRHAHRLMIGFVMSCLAACDDLPSQQALRPNRHEDAQAPAPVTDSRLADAVALAFDSAVQGNVDGLSATPRVDSDVTRPNPDASAPAPRPDSSAGTIPQLSPLPPAPTSPNPKFSGLDENTAVDLGAYTCADRMPEEGIATHCYKITDYSRFNYDPYNHRILMFGGGHAATGRTDVDVFSLSTLTWSSLYPTMTCEQIQAGELPGRLDPRGFHVPTGHPVARHTFDMTVVAKAHGKGQLLLLSNEGLSGDCHKRYVARIEAVASLELGPGGSARSWSYSPSFAFPWSYAAAAEFDPVSNKVIVVGSGKGASASKMWVYDPETSEIVASVNWVEYREIDNNLVYHPPTDAMYMIVRGTPNRVYRIDLDRSSWSQSTSTLLNLAGTPPSSTSTSGWAYDGHAKVIGGGVLGGRFYTLDPNPGQGAWRSQKMKVQSAVGATPDQVVFHHLDYDGVDNVYVFITGHASSKRTWAYRYRN